MKHNKDQLIQDTIMMMYIFVIVFCFSLLITEWYGSPSVEFKSYLLNVETGYTDYGYYENFENDIKLSINHYDVLGSLYHEYAHYIYYKLMSVEEKEEWSKLVNKNLYRLQIYDEKNKIKEGFAFTMQDYISLNDGQRNCINKDYYLNWIHSDEAYDFCSRMFYKYID